LTKPVLKVYATRFFQLITTRQFAEAERILERVKEKMHISERNRGYFQALSGMLLTQKNNDDRYAFLSSMNPPDKKQLKSYRQEFLSHTESRLHAEYDRGFFEAWADYTRILPRLTEPSQTTSNTNIEQKQSEAAIEPEAQKAEPETTAETKKEEDAPAEEKTPEIQPSKQGQSTLFDYAK